MYGGMNVWGYECMGVWMVIRLIEGHSVAQVVAMSTFRHSDCFYLALLCEKLCVT